MHKPYCFYFIHPQFFSDALSHFQLHTYHGIAAITEIWENMVAISLNLKLESLTKVFSICLARVSKLCSTFSPQNPQNFWSGVVPLIWSVIYCTFQ